MTAEIKDDTAAPAFLAAAKAARVHEFGPPDVITLEDWRPSVPLAGEVLVRVKAAGVGPWDAWVRAGKSALPQPLPLTPGSDIAGRIVALGPDVAGFAVGDAVFGVTNPRFTGGYADYAIASAAMLAHKPDGLADLDAASVPVVAVTAWQALFEHARLRHGQSVLIHGGAGNVGAYAVQLARAAGLRVVVTARHRDHAFVRSLGADILIDPDAEAFEARAGRVDAVLDLVGGHVQERSFAVVKPGGFLISAVAPPDQARAAASGITALFFLVEVTTARLDEIARRLEAGNLRTQLGAVLPLASARIAHEMLEGTRPRPRGKIVLQVAE